MNKLGKLSKGLLIATLTFPMFVFAASEGLKIEKPWVQATVPGQRVAAAFLRITASNDMTLVGGSTPIADSLELHFMRMDNGVMEMRRHETVDLPKGKTIAFEPGGLHMMLIGIKKRINVGDNVPISLIFEDRNGKQSVTSIQLEARVDLH